MCEGRVKSSALVNPFATYKPINLNVVAIAGMYETGEEELQIAQLVKQVESDKWSVKYYNPLQQTFNKFVKANDANNTLIDTSVIIGSIIMSHVTQKNITVS